MPIAENCRVVPDAVLALTGVTLMAASVAEDTVSVVPPETAPDLAVIVAEPAATDIARPLDPAELLIAATVMSDELQVTDAVRSWVELFE